MAHEIYTILFSSLAGIATLLGILLVLRYEKWAVKNSHYLNSAAAGSIIFIAFLHLLPEAVELNSDALIFAFGGFLLFYLLESVIVIHSGAEVHYHGPDDTTGHSHSLEQGFNRGTVIFSGLAFHSAVDGIIIGAGFSVSFELGLLAALSVVLHETAEGITSFSILINVIREKALLLSVFIALATPFGAFLAIFFIGTMELPMVGAFIALAGGSFLYIAASDLIPETHESGRIWNAILFLVGIILTLLLSLALPE